jgi:hypothetical protein
MNELMFVRAIEFVFGDCDDDMAEPASGWLQRLVRPYSHATILWQLLSKYRFARSLSVIHGP